MVPGLDLAGHFYAGVERKALDRMTRLWPFLPEDLEAELLARGRLHYRIYNGRASDILPRAGAGNRCGRYFCCCFLFISSI